LVADATLCHSPGFSGGSSGHQTIAQKRIHAHQCPFLSRAAHRSQPRPFQILDRQASPKSIHRLSALPISECSHLNAERSFSPSSPLAAAAAAAAASLIVGGTVQFANPGAYQHRSTSPPTCHFCGPHYSALPAVLGPLLYKIGSCFTPMSQCGRPRVHKLRPCSPWRWLPFRQHSIVQH
jgi:hypothetical protein